MTPTEDVSQLIKPHLKRREKLIWAGRPNPRAFIGWSSIAIGIFCLCFAGMLAHVFKTTGGTVMTPIYVFGGFLALLLWVALSSVRREWAEGRRLCYAVTNRRALILREGRPAALKSFPPADMTKLEVDTSSIIFAGDSALDGFMPGYHGFPETTMGPVGFIGLPADVVPEVQRHLETLKAAPPPDDEGEGVDSRRSADPERIYEVAARYAIAREQLEGWADETSKAESKRQFDAHGGCLKGVAVLAVLALVATIALAIALKEPGVIVAGLTFLVPAFLVLVVMALIVQVVFVHVYGSKVQKRPQAFLFLDRLAGDRHPDTYLHGWLDVGDVRGVRPTRMANSPHSGALKTYHKHHWARFVLGLADGNALAVSLIDKVKLKGGFEVTRRHFLRGRLHVNPAHFEVSRLTEPFTAGRLTAVPQPVGDRVVIYFGGEISQPNEVADQLAALYRQLPVKA